MIMIMTMLMIFIMITIVVTCDIMIKVLAWSEDRAAWLQSTLLEEK